MHLLVDEPLRHRLDRQTTIHLHDLTLEVLVLQLQELNLALQVENNLFFLVHLNYWLVLNVHCACRIIQSRNRLIGVYLRGRDAGNHQCSGCSTQTILQQHRQFRITERNILEVLRRLL